MRRRTSAMVLSALLLAPAGMPVSAAADLRVPCDAFDHGPALSPKPVLLCYGFRDGFVAISVSTDRGRTWTEKRPVGTPEPADHLFSALVSPSYDTDKTLYLHYQALGLFASTDGGGTFAPVDTQASGERGDRVSAIDGYGPPVPGVPAAPAVAIPGQGGGVFYHGQHVPVVGSGRQQERGFYQLGHGVGSVVLNASQGPDESFAPITQVAHCTPELACPGGFAFPKRMQLHELVVDPASTATTALALMMLDRQPSVWVTRDRGRTFTRNTAFDRDAARYLAPERNFVWIEGVTVLPGGREWLVGFQTTKVQVLMATTDGGRNWHRRTYPKGTTRIVAGRDGRLYGSGRFVFRCSVDRGRTWHDRCPR